METKIEFKKGEIYFKKGEIYYLGYKNNSGFINLSGGGETILHYISDSNDGVFGNTYTGINYLFAREATEFEKKWLQACIELKNIIPKNLFKDRFIKDKLNKSISLIESNISINDFEGVEIIKEVIKMLE